MSGEHPLPLIQRFPSLAAISRARLGSFPSRVDDASAIAPDLWIKRDDLNATPLGGNKVRALEFLLGGVRPGDGVATVGSVASTHALATALYARTLGARVAVGLWPQETNPTAAIVADRLARSGAARRVFPAPALAIAWSYTKRWRGWRVIPAGGTSPLGALGHVNAALELADQIERGLLPEPGRIIVPLGTGGTAAGLVLGCRIAGLRTTIVAVRVVPRIIGRRGRIVRLANATARLIRRHTTAAVPSITADDVVVVHDQYGGAYARETRAGREAVERFSLGAAVTLDATYTAKSAACALAASADSTRASNGPTLVWLTFDPSILNRAEEIHVAP